MTKFESQVNISRPVNEVYNFLADMNNHERLMPDEVQGWTSTVDEASFGIKNMVKLSLKVAARVENQEIRIVPAVKAPFDVVLRWILSPNGGGTTAVFTMEADLNMMMKMMASGPLKKLADHETQSLATLLG
ncbi:MAG: SRPBCC family protein [Bacteroidota bacterium]|nr:SRPBCC family protein [Bacteroidota bacterium]